MVETVVSEASLHVKQPQTRLTYRRCDLATIQAPVALWHGLQDTTPPPAHSRWLADHIPHATAHFPAGQDHTNVEENNRRAAIAWVRSHM